MVSNALWNVWKSALRPLEVLEFAVSDAPARGPPSECALFRIREMHCLTPTSKKQNSTVPSECALFRIRNVRFFAAKSTKQNHTFASECAFFRRQIFRFHPAQNCSKTAFSNKPAAASKIQHHIQYVHFFAATRNRENHSFPPICALFRIQQAHFNIATSKKQNHTFPSECALFRRQIFR